MARFSSSSCRAIPRCVIWACRSQLTFFESSHLGRGSGAAGGRGRGWRPGAGSVRAAGHLCALASRFALSSAFLIVVEDVMSYTKPSERCVDGGSL